MSSLNVGDLVTAHVIGIHPMLVRIAVGDQPGVIRGSAATRVTVGMVIKARITQTDVGGRFEATLVHP